jgi:hypothetical protein
MTNRSRKLDFSVYCISRACEDRCLVSGEIGALDRQGRYRYSDALGCPQRIEDQSIPLLRQDNQYSRTEDE